MTYKLRFNLQALKEWERLDAPIRDQFQRKLKERIEFPEVPKDRLRGAPNTYKIKLRASGFRLVYEVVDDQLVVLVLAVGKRAACAVYEASATRH
ncbi:MAG: type II toxin-antitoxin system RelE family toxin [Janthinobacterium lividum]